MNGWLLFILAVIILGFLLDLAVSLTTLKALSPTLPESFSDIFSPEKYRRSQQYTRATTRLALIETSVITFASVVFLLAGGFNFVDLLARAPGFGPIPTGLLFCAILLLLSFFLSLPFSIYSTFYLEERFDFNRTRPGTFIADIAKSVLLALLIGGPVLALILWFFETAGAFAWFYCWLGVVFFSLIMQFLAPVLILPLFNTYTPLDAGALREKIQTYLDQEQFTLADIYTMDGSRRSTKLNAFFTGFGRFRKIAFFDTLVEKLDNDEIVAVLAHEMGHFKKRHIWKISGLSWLQTGLLFYLLSYFINNPGVFEAFRMESLSIYASLVFFAYIFSPLNTLLSIGFKALSRQYEFEADRYAADSTGRPEQLIRALKKLSLENLSNLTPHPLAVALRYSHPPVLQRIGRLEAIPDNRSPRPAG